MKTLSEKMRTSVSQYNLKEEDVKQFIKDLKEGELAENLIRVFWEELQLERYQSSDETLKKLKLKIEGQIEITIDKLAGRGLIDA